MPKTKRETKPFTMQMDREIADRLERFCEESGQSKTTAVERALAVYIDQYDKQQKILREHSGEFQE